MTYMRGWKSHRLTSQALIHKLGDLSQGLSVPLVYLFIFFYGRFLWEVIFHKFGNSRADIILMGSDGGLLTDSRTICDAFNE
jgi:hypothetical protein